MPLKTRENRVRDPEEDRLVVSPAMRAAEAGAFFHDDRFDYLEDSLEEVSKAMEAVRRREERAERTPPADGGGVAGHPDDM